MQEGGISRESFARATDQRGVSPLVSSCAGAGATAMTFETSVPLYEWQGEGDPAREITFDYDGVDRSEPAHQLFNMELAYQRGDFRTARRMADHLITNSDDEWVVLSAMATRIVVAMATNHVEAAYLCMPNFVSRCQEGLRNAQDPVLYGTCLVLARRIETLLMADLFEFPQSSNGVDHLPGGLKAYLGSLMSARELHCGNVGKAEGIIFAFRSIIGVHYPMARVALALFSSAVATVSDRIKEGEVEFKAAWDLASETGVIMPIIEASKLMPGTHRHCFPDRSDTQYRRIEALAQPYYKGWYGLREKCGISNMSESLTPVEWYVLRLAGMGWRNKEIAAYLHMSENTVKHRLTGCYQKMGLSSRADLPALMRKMRQVPRVTF